MANGQTISRISQDYPRNGRRRLLDSPHLDRAMHVITGIRRRRSKITGETSFTISIRIIWMRHVRQSHHGNELKWMTRWMNGTQAIPFRDNNNKSQEKKRQFNDLETLTKKKYVERNDYLFLWRTTRHPLRLCLNYEFRSWLATGDGRCIERKWYTHLWSDIWDKSRLITLI